MKKYLMTYLLLLMALPHTYADNKKIDISGDNTSTSYKTYSTAVSLPQGETLDVMMARYCYFSSKITGSGVLNLYGGGDRCYLGTEKGKAWPDWTKFTGDVHIWPFTENSSSAGSYGVLLAHGGKSSSPENALDDAKGGKVNPSMANNRVTLHAGATMTCEANTSGAGFRIGELNTEAGSVLSGYYKKSRSVYYLLGGLNTDFKLAGTIKPTDYDNATLLSIVKEGTGTLTITGNDNYVSGGLRILEGRVNLMNYWNEAKINKQRGALGARPNPNEPIAYVFENGVLGGIGSIAGTVDNYGTIAPGLYDSYDTGCVLLRNYVDGSLQPDLIVHPVSKLRIMVLAVFPITQTEHGTIENDLVEVGGNLKFSDMMQDFTTSDKMPVVELYTPFDRYGMVVGDEITLLTAKAKVGDWHFELKQPSKYTWELVEETTDKGYALKARVVSLENSDDPDNPDNPDNPDSTMGAFYDDGIDDAKDSNTLKYYAAKNQKSVGVALATYKGYQSDRDAAGKQFNMMVCENEMKMDALQPSQGSFSFGSADQLVSFAQKNNMTVRGHCLVWHSQQPSWVSSDGKKNDKNWTRQQALDIMKNHITKVMQHYKGKVREWDVVNECLDDNQTCVYTNLHAYDLRQQSVWQQAIGDDYIDSAFVYAHRADPDAVLYLNDYGVELQGKAKSAAFFNLATRLKNDGIPIDGVGLQCHFSIGDVDSVKLDNTITRFAAVGLKCIITELDMGIPSTSEANLQEQARNYRVVTDIMLNHDNCPSMVIWGIKDNDSWREASSPLLYTSGLDKKPAWYAVRSALRHRALNSGDGIHTVHQTEPSDGRAYNLAGQRVGSDYHGIIIINGKKVYK